MSKKRKFDFSGLNKSAKSSKKRHKKKAHKVFAAAVRESAQYHSWPQYDDAQESDMIGTAGTHDEFRKKVDQMLLRKQRRAAGKSPTLSEEDLLMEFDKYGDEDEWTEEGKAIYLQMLRETREYEEMRKSRKIPKLKPGESYQGIGVYAHRFEDTDPVVEEAIREGRNPMDEDELLQYIPKKRKKFLYPDLRDLSEIRPYVCHSMITEDMWRKIANVQLGWNIDFNDPYRLNKKALTKREYQLYKSFGVPDLTQDWLELFVPSVIEDLFSILHADASNATKASVIMKELGHYGFEAGVGEGTNILVLQHSRYPGVVFKIALDPYGIADNFNDEMLQYVIPRYARVLARHYTGIVSVQERYVVMDKERMKDFKDRVTRTLEQLSEKYLVADLSPVRFLNFGVGRDGEFVIIDGSDLIPIEELDHKVRCRNSVGWNEKKKKIIRCGGKLVYTTDFLSMECTKCGHQINPLELRNTRKEKDSDMSQAHRDGSTHAERMEWERLEIEALERRARGDTEIVASGAKASATEEVSSEMIGSQVDTAEPRVYDIDTDDDPEPDTDRETDREEDLYEDDEEDDDELDDDDDVIEEDCVSTKNIPYAGHRLHRILNEDDEMVKKREHDSMLDFDEEDDSDDDVDDDPEPPASVEFFVIPPDDKEQGGLHLVIHGDWKEAWKNSGIPIYASFDDGETYDLAITASVLGELLDYHMTQVEEGDPDPNQSIILPV